VCLASDDGSVSKSVTAADCRPLNSETVHQSRDVESLRTVCRTLSYTF